MFRRILVMGTLLTLVVSGCSLGSEYDAYQGPETDTGDAADGGDTSEPADVDDADTPADTDADSVEEDVPGMDVDVDDEVPDTADAEDASDTADAPVDTGDCDEEDEPDHDRIDSNCDGVDGNALAAIFVAPDAGDDLNDGSAQSPVRTLPRAVELARGRGRAPIYLQKGNYSVRQPLQIPEGVNLHGGYDREPGGWTRPPASVQLETVISGPSPVLTYAGLARPTRLDSVAVQSATGLDGQSSVAVAVLRSGPFLHIEDCQIRGGVGGTGLPGAPGTTGPTGMPGGHPSGGTAGSGGVSADCAASGGPGGAGGVGNAIAGRPGVVGSRGAMGGAGGQAAMNGEAGDSGEAGGNGDAGEVGSAEGRFEDDYWFPNGSMPGGRGLPGGGGGGGGGGGFSVGAVQGQMNGGGGGGGGSGGCGGAEGGGGGGGGASIGLLVVGSTVTLERTTVTASRGGAGGVGGRGGQGGGGGTGGGGDTCLGCSAVGGRGGNGGNGGCGANGPGGPGGPSLAVLLVPANDNAAVESGDEVTLTADGGGNPGLGGNAPGCPDSVQAETGPAGRELTVACCIPEEGGACDALDICP